MNRLLTHAETQLREADQLAVELASRRGARARASVHQHEALRHVSMIGNDLALDGGMATCGKQGQTPHVGIGQPTPRIDRTMVGGRAG